MIDNFKKFKTWLDFSDPTKFYYIQIIQRSKDIDKLTKNNRMVKAYFVYSLEYLEKKEQEMKEIANSTKGRIYIHPGRRDSKVVALEHLEQVATMIKNHQEEFVHKAYTTACGRHHSKDKLWVIDIDVKDEVFVQDVIYFIGNLEPVGDKCSHIIPTKSGFHLITTPFNTEKFKKQFSDVEIHKNNPTLLFIP
jgi:hypothetical protein